MGSLHFKIIGKTFALSPNIYLLMYSDFFAFICLKTKNNTVMVTCTGTFSQNVDESSSYTFAIRKTHL